MPAEWGKQQGLFINYSGNSNDAETSEKVHKVCRDIIRELSAVTRVYVLINEEYKRTQSNSYLLWLKFKIRMLYCYPFISYSLWEFQGTMVR